MALVLRTDGLEPEKLSPEVQLWAYNGLDCMITHEVWQDLTPKMPEPCFAYDMSRSMLGPSYDLQRRGVRIDQELRASSISRLKAERERLETLFTRLCQEVWDVTASPTSPKQLLWLFYEVMGFEPILIYDKLTREQRPSTNRDCLEKLAKEPRAKPYAELILAMRDSDKQLQVLMTGVEKGRMHCSYHVAGTLTGRWSSTSDPFGSGTNLQNLSDEMRRMFIPDKGKKFCQLDLAQAESKVVAYLCLPWGRNYLNACLSGDLHTFTCKLVWPELPWGTAPDKEIAERKYYRQFSYRDLAKRGSHGSNYGAKPGIMATNLKIPLAVAEEFQRKYFLAFPEIPKWHNDVKIRLVRDRCIRTPLGRVCHFPGRPNDSDTIKSAIAYAPQSTIGDTLNLGFRKVWELFDRGAGFIEVLTQVHDSILFQYLDDPRVEAELIPLLQKEIVVPLLINGEECVIHSDAKVGWNWGKRIEDARSGKVENEWGLADYKGRDTRGAPSQVSLLDRRVYSIY